MARKKSDAIVVLAFDPGIYHTGWSISKYDRTAGNISVTAYGTIDANSIAKKEKREDYKVYGNLVSFFALEREVTNLVTQHEPDYVACEGAFAARFMNAFVSLKLCIHAIQRALYLNFGKTLYLIAPKEAKKAVGKGTADKGAVQNSIRHLDNLKIKDTKQQPIDRMVEHEADSIAIGYAFIRNVLPDLLLNAV